MTLKNIPPIRLGDLEFSLIQGGMGVGISLAGLASAVANEGGAGIIAAVGGGALGSYSGGYVEKNQEFLKKEIMKARKKTRGVIGVNIMHVLSDYSALVQTAVDANADLIISGAGLPLDLPKYLRKDSLTKLIPIVSSAKAIQILTNTWIRRYNSTPDAVIVEGPKAGGHLGYSSEQLSDPDFIEYGLEEIVPEVINTLKPYESKFKKKVPVIVAGGIYYGGDIRKFLEIGAKGVQMASRFVTTHECDAPMEFKEAYLKCKKEDIVLIDSPVGMPGRAIRNVFLDRVNEGMKVPINCPFHCLKSCKPETSPYCIARALVNAQKGKIEEGFVFCGTNAWKNNEIISVHELFERLNDEYDRDIRSS